MLSLGRNTYLEFAALWPGLGADVPMADSMKNTPTYIVSSTLTTLGWAGSTLVTGGLDEVAKLKEQPAKVEVGPLNPPADAPQTARS